MNNTFSEHLIVSAFFIDFIIKLESTAHC